MSIRVLPQMSVSELEKLVKSLPAPRSVVFGLYGDFSFDDLSKQCGTIIPGLQISNAASAEFEIADPSNEKILEIYRRQQEYVERFKLGDFPKPYRGINLSKAVWTVKDRDMEMELELTPASVHVRYKNRLSVGMGRILDQVPGTVMYTTERK